MEEPKETITLTYDERKKILVRTITREKKGEIVKTEIILNEDKIKEIFKGLESEKKQYSESLKKQDNFLKRLNEDKEKLEVVTLTKEQIKLKEDLDILNKYVKVEEIDSKIKQTLETIEYVKKDISNKNKLIGEIKSKAKNLNLK